MLWVIEVASQTASYTKDYFCFDVTDKKVSGKSKDEQMAEKKQELEKRLQDVTGQLGHQKKSMKKGRVSYSVQIPQPCTLYTFDV